MKWTGLNELREEFLSFFESKAHLRRPSAPLVPIDDNSLLLINSGMAPLKNYFLGLETPPSKRMTTCQKCIRTPDIEEVGKTSRHGTYFEMLGNFSFGDYFKEEATEWALEFLHKTLAIPMDKLWITIYQDDDEAFDIWTQKRGVSPDKIVRLGKADNFWEIGTGPCGPCSELHFDRGEEYGCGDNCGIGKCDCDRYMEIWNLVFTQFNSDGEGTYTPLEHPNIDTGMGLERLACVMQGVDNLFEVDTVKNIMAKIIEITGKEYKKDEKTDVSLRVITDHIRSTVFMIGDGVLPSNEGRGYVLRRLLRRAARHGHLLGVSDPFLYEVCRTVVQENQGQYPDLKEKQDYIIKTIRAEEERFGKTIQQGMETLSGIIDQLETRVISGKDAFQLYDTFGFPIDLTREIASDHGVEIDEQGFKAYMEEQRARARKAYEQQGGIGWEEDVLAELDITDKFVGYSLLEVQTKIQAVVKDNQLADAISEGEEGVLVLEQTPFYAESGGQVGDTGRVFQGDSIFEVIDTQKSPTGHILHIGKVSKGIIRANEPSTATIDRMRREKIRRNHTSLHLLQSALREVLGDHVHQAGSYVNEDFARFDFTHFSAVTKEELKQIEAIVNTHILESIPVEVAEMPIEKAKKQGAIALFGDKYSDVVRVCAVSDVSVELCGGTHVDNSAQIGVFKIISESSVAAGARRIEVTTGMGVLKLLEKQSEMIQNVGQIFKVNSLDDLIAKARATVQQMSELRSQVESLECKLVNLNTENFGENLIDLGSVKLAVLAISGKIEPLQRKADELKANHPNLVGIMIAMGEDKGTVLAFAGESAVKAGVHSGKLVKEIAAITGGSGGGKPENAKGGIQDLSKVDDALAAAKGLVQAQLEQ